MIPLNPGQLVPLLTYPEVTSALKEQLLKTIHEDSYNPITGVSMDSRDILMGEMFLALDGEKFRGIDFVPTAYACGVRVFVIAESDFPKSRFWPSEVLLYSCFLLVKDPVIAYQYLAAYYLERMKIFRIAVTGSAGKTTTKEMLSEILKGIHGVFSTRGNENNHFGVPKNVFLLQRKLTAGDDIRIAIFELGMNHLKEIDALASVVRPHLGLITNILYAHIGNFSQREDLVEAKGEMIPHLTGHEGHDLLPHDPGGILLIPQDIFGKDLLLEKAKVLSPPPTVFEVGAEMSIQTLYKPNSRHKITSQWIDNLTEEKIEVPGLSIFLGKTLPLVLKAGEILGLPRREGIRRLAEKQVRKSTLNSFELLSGLGNRLKIIDLPQKPLLIDDTYNANPDSMIEAVTALIALVSQTPPEVRLKIVLGDMLELGSFSQALHKECGMKISQAISTLAPDDQKRVEFFLLGREMKICYDFITSSGKQYYDNDSPEHPEILDDLGKNCDEHSMIFFKASHGMQFDRLLKHFMARFTDVASASPLPDKV